MRGTKVDLTYTNVESTEKINSMNKSIPLCNELGFSKCLFDHDCGALYGKFIAWSIVSNSSSESFISNLFG